MEKRKCNKCHKLLPLTTEYFCKCSRCTDNLNYQCKQCIKEYQVSIKDKLQAYQKEYQPQYKAEHKEKLNEYGRVYTLNRYHNDPEFKEKMLINQRARNAKLRKLKKKNDK
jgi:hypothetical protein